jgi:hypothetical protein
MRARRRWVCQACRRITVVVQGVDPRCQHCPDPTAMGPSVAPWAVAGADDRDPIPLLMGLASVERHLARRALAAAIDHVQAPRNGSTGDPWTLTVLYAAVAMVNGAPVPVVLKEITAAHQHYSEALSPFGGLRSIVIPGRPS